MSKKILIILGHPNPKSFCGALARAYHDGAQAAGAEVRNLVLSELTFDPILRYGYGREQELEPGIVAAQEMITWAEHLVFVYPIWWGTTPALLKGFLDRTLLPGYAFKYRKGTLWWDKLLTGRSAHLIVTMDTPPWYYWLKYGRPGHRAMKQMVLEFCGISPVRVTSIGPIKSSSDEKRSQWLARARSIGTTMS